jgi:hypothetical protein
MLVEPAIREAREEIREEALDIAESELLARYCPMQPKRGMSSERLNQSETVREQDGRVEGG